MASGLRLRFDRVAVGFLAELEAGLVERIPPGTSVLVTVTAPIVRPYKTRVALEERIVALLHERGRVDFADTIDSNGVRVRVIASVPGTPKFSGFVHNPDAAAERRLLDDIETRIGA